MKNAQHSSLTTGARFYLAFTVAVGGALVMLVEVMGARLIGPFFGVSLYVWTSLIAVTLAALSAGYWLGGGMADRLAGRFEGMRAADPLYLALLAAGVLVLAVPYLKLPILRLVEPLGLRAGAFAAALLLFGPPLALMGAVSPLAVKLAARDAARLGRTVGGLYAISTLGSLTGTVAAGFYLIGVFGVSGLFTLSGLALLALAGGHFLVFRRQWAALAVLVMPLLPLAPAPVDAVTLPNGTQARKLAGLQSHYGAVSVIEFSHGEARTREMLIDGLIQGGLDPVNGLAVYEYLYLAQHVPLALNPDGKKALAIGLGAGIVPMAYARRGLSVDVVDIDPNVVRLAGEYFGFKPSGRVSIEDARAFLAQLQERYDHILLDVFNGDTTPGHMMSRESFALMRERLAPGGVLAINLVGALHGRNLGTASVVQTLKSVFETVAIQPAFDIWKNNAAKYGNLLLLAYDGPERPIRRDLLSTADIHPMASAVRDWVGKTVAFEPGTPALLLTDDFNPLDLHDAWIKEAVRRDILNELDWNLLLGG
jgi:predicted membrane-bound spermidine synthase